MRVAPSASWSVSHPYSSHRSGASAAWRDPNYRPTKRLEIPIVWKGLGDFALPAEEAAPARRPGPAADPYAALDAVQHRAALDEERGRRALRFLRGDRAA